MIKPLGREREKRIEQLTKGIEGAKKWTEIYHLITCFLVYLNRDELLDLTNILINKFNRR